MPPDHPWSSFIWSTAGIHSSGLLRGLTLFHGLGCPVLVGVSRKGLTGAHHERYEPRDRLPGSLVAAAVAWDQGVQMVRVHDVAETVQARMIWEALHPVL